MSGRCWLLNMQVWMWMHRIPFFLLSQKLLRLEGKVYCIYNMYFIFLYSLCLNHLLLDKYLECYACDTCRYACRSSHKVIFLSDFNQNLNVLINFSKSIRYEIRKSISSWVCFIYTGGWKTAELKRWSTRFQKCSKMLCQLAFPCSSIFPLSANTYSTVTIIALSDMRHNFNSTGIQKSATVMCMSHFWEFSCASLSNHGLQWSLEQSWREEGPHHFDQTISWCLGMFMIYLQTKFHMSAMLFTPYMKSSLIKVGLFKVC
jgi:hypothetical protein